MWITDPLRDIDTIDTELALVMDLGDGQCLLDKAERTAQRR